jgi:hypothetical protein
MPDLKIIRTKTEIDFNNHRTDINFLRRTASIDKFYKTTIDRSPFAVYAKDLIFDEVLKILLINK